jgi:hypothetical protein
MQRPECEGTRLSALSRAVAAAIDRLTLCDLPFSDAASARLRKRWGPRVEFATQDEWC